jgi:hypothetical protein
VASVSVAFCHSFISLVGAVKNDPDSVVLTGFSSVHFTTLAGKAI